MGATDGALTQTELTAALLAAVSAAGARPPENFSVTVPGRPEHGDLTTDIALRLTDQNRAPLAGAEEICRQLQRPPTVAAATVAPPGFINFTLTDRGWSELLAAWLGGSLFQTDRAAGQRVVVDFSSPNIAKPFSIGHFRSTVLGDATARANEALGATVIRVNYLGDWGTQFGKLLVALERWGGETPPTSLTQLLELYVRFHHEAESNPALEDEARAAFARLEAGDERAREQWAALVAISLAEFSRLYDRLGVRFDHLADRGESYYVSQAGMVLAELQQKGLAKESAGASVLVWPDEALPTTVLMKKDGATVYLLRDLAALRDRLTAWRADRVIYHVGSEQTLHFQQLVRAAQLLGWLDRRPDGSQPEVLVAHHGLYRLPDGKMSTRRGRGVLLDDLLETGLEQAKTLIKTKDPGVAPERLERLAEILAVGALKYNDLSHHRQHNIIFNWQAALNLEGNSAPYLIYTHARACGLFRQAGLDMERFAPDTAVAAHLTDPRERRLLLQALPLRQSLLTAAAQATPHVVADQLYHLASLFNSYYGATRIITEDQKLTEARLALTKGVARALRAGLALLGLAAPEEI